MTTSTLRSFRRALAGALAGGFLYANAAVITRPLARAGAFPVALPLPQAVADLFCIFGVFSSYETVNREVELEALCVRVEGMAAISRWVELDAERYFPFPRGERHTRLWAAGRSGGLPGLAPEEGRRLLAARIKARYERENPGEKLERIRVGATTWPRSTRGYDAERTPESTVRVHWYEVTP
jgi:hypothetical protein